MTEFINNFGQGLSFNSFQNFQPFQDFRKFSYANSNSAGYVKDSKSLFPDKKQGVTPNFVGKPQGNENSLKNFKIFSSSESEDQGIISFKAEKLSQSEKRGAIAYGNNHQELMINRGMKKQESKSDETYYEKLIKKYDTLNNSGKAKPVREESTETPKLLPEKSAVVPEEVIKPPVEETPEIIDNTHSGKSAQPVIIIPTPPPISEEEIPPEEEVIPDGNQGGEEIPPEEEVIPDGNQGGEEIPPEEEVIPDGNQGGE